MTTFAQLASTSAVSGEDELLLSQGGEEKRVRKDVLLTAEYISTSGGFNVQQHIDGEAGKAHDTIYDRRTTVAEIASGVFIEAGAVLTVDDRAAAKFTLTIGGTPNGFDILDAGNGNTAVLKITHSVVNVKFFGAMGDGATDDTNAIQAAFNAASHIYIPSGTYIVGELNVPSNIRVEGAGFTTVLKIPAGTSHVYGCLYNTDSLWENVIIENLTIDGGLNYPVDFKTYRQDVTKNRAVYKSGSSFNVTIKHCRFQEMSTASILVQNGDNTTGFNILNNHFINGNYELKTIGIYGSDGASDTAKPRGILIDGNQLTDGGPKYHWDCSVEDWTASTDAIHLDNCRDSTISNNNIRNTSGEAIRIEQSKYVSVIGNHIYRPGNNGITLYLNTFDCTVIGNTIEEWGATIQGYCLRKYNNKYYICREFPNASYAPLPVDPTTVTWIEECPYVLDPLQIDLSTVIDYDPNDYYIGVNQGILPYRGASAISVTNGSYRNKIIGNTCRGSTDVDGGGKYFLGSRHGYSNRHTVNVASDTTGDSCTVSGNSFSRCQDKELYAGRYQDPVNERGESGLQYISDNSFSAHRGGNGLYDEVYENLSLTVSQGVIPLQLNPQNGTATLQTNFTNVSFYRVGQLVTISGQVRVASVSGALGVLYLGNLPYVPIALPDEAERATGVAALTNTEVTDITQYFVSGAGDLIYISGTTGQFGRDVSEVLKSGTVININFSYRTQA